MKHVTTAIYSRTGDKQYTKDWSDRPQIHRFHREESMAPCTLIKCSYDAQTYVTSPTAPLKSGKRAQSQSWGGLESLLAQPSSKVLNHHVHIRGHATASISGRAPVTKA